MITSPAFFMNISRRTMEWEESWKSSYKLDCGTDFLPPDTGLTCEQTLWKGSLDPTERWCETACWGSHNAIYYSRLGVLGHWMTLTLQQRCAQGSQIFQCPFLMYVHFWSREYQIMISIRTDAISFVSVWISQKKQPLLGFNSQVIVQNRAPRQKYGQQYYPGFSFSGSSLFISTPFKLVINFVVLFMDWIFKDSTQTFRNTQTFGGCVSWGGFFLISG